MDFVRSCYTVDMDFAGDGSRVRRVRWYFAEETAEVFPGPHSFMSGNWFPIQKQTVGLGERWDSDRPWNNGQAPPGASGTGQPCGPLDWFLNGVPADAPDLVLTTGGLPQCCVPNPGILVGGTTTARNYLNHSLSGVLLGATSSLRVLAPGGSGLRAGGIGYPRLVRLSTGGIRPGGTSSLRVRRSSLGGLRAGGTSTQTLRNLSTGGVKVGGVGSERTQNLSTGGILVGGTDAAGSPKISFPGTLGVKGAPSGVVVQGPITGCCPFNAVPLTLFGTTNGIASTYVYSSGTQRWEWPDPISGFVIALRCQNLGGGVFHWQLRALPSTHCTIVDTLTSITCNPFAINVGVTQSGGACVASGSWNAILHG